MDVRASGRRHAPVVGEEVRRQARDLRGQRRIVQRRLQLRRDDRALRASDPRRGRAGDRGDLPERRGIPGVGVGPHRGVGPQRCAVVLRQLSDHACIRPPARAVETQELRRRDDPSGGRDRRGQHGAGRGVHRSPRGDGHERAGDRSEGGDDRSRRHHGAADDPGRRDARRPIHRDADEERAGRSVARDVRPPRGVAHPDRGPVVAGGLLLRGDGSCRASRSATGPR